MAGFSGSGLVSQIACKDKTRSEVGVSSDHAGNGVDGSQLSAMGDHKLPLLSEVVSR